MKLLMTVIVIICLSSASTGAPVPGNWFAAACLSNGRHCKKDIAQKSGACRQKTPAREQSSRCRFLACAYCRTKARQRTGKKPNLVCRSTVLQKVCFGKVSPPRRDRSKKAKRKTPSPRPTRTPPRTTPRTAPRTPARTPTPSPVAATAKTTKPCAFRSVGDVVAVPASQFPLSRKSRAWKQNRNGSITYKPNGDHRIDAPGSAEICFPVAVSNPGQYYMTLKTQAPHPTDFNDCWIKISSGVDLFRPKTKAWLRGRGGAPKYYKGYQNSGKMAMADYLVTVDFRGYQMITRPLQRNRKYTVCISGRSARFVIHEFRLVKCSGLQCNRNHPLVRKGVGAAVKSRCK